MNPLLALASGGVGAPVVYSDDVFLANVRTGTGATATITGGPNMSGSGGLHVTKSRSTTTGWRYTSTTRGATKSLDTSSTAAEATESTGVTAFTSSGATIGADADYNASGQTFVDYFFRTAPKFFFESTKAHTNGVASTVDLSSLGTVGYVLVKRMDSTGNWFAWHRSLSAGQITYRNLNNAATTDASISVSGTTLTIASANTTGSYAVMAWADDSSATGIVQCGSFTTDGSGNATVTLGWELQYLEYKGASGSNPTGHLAVVDTARSFSLTAQLLLFAGLTDADLGVTVVTPTSTGFVIAGLGASTTFVFTAIRRPNKPPTSGTQVYSAVSRSGTGAVAQITAGFAADVLLHLDKGRGWDTTNYLTGRLRGNQYVNTSGTASEAAYNTVFQNDNGFATNDGVLVTADSSMGAINHSGTPYINYFFKRAAGFMDEVFDAGTGSAHTIAHNLTVVPELMIRKCRSGAAQWEVYCAALANTEKLVLNSTAAKATDTTAWNSTTPTSSVFTVGTGANVNTNASTYGTLLFATLAGISKIGTYTGTAAALQIDCGFSAGARFVLIKRVDSTGDWYLWDSVRGIVSGNDPYIRINSTAAEVTNTDYIDPYSAGFELSSTAPAALNASGGTYIFLAIA